jgi:hypothetical protein
MAITIVQCDGFGNFNLNSSSLLHTYFEPAFGMTRPTAGDAMVSIVEWSGEGATVESVADTWGNNYQRVPGSASNSNGYYSEIWWASNIVVGADFFYTLTVTYSKALSLAAGIVLHDVRGINDASIVVVTGTGDASVAFDGPSLNGGAGAFYIVGACGTGALGFETTGLGVSSPWAFLTSGGDGSNDETNLNCATMVGSGAQQPVFTPLEGGFSGVLVGAAFIPGGGGGGNVPFLGSVVEVGSVPSGMPNSFLGTYKIVSAAPGNQAVGQPGNPYLGHIVVVEAPPDDYDGPNVVLGEVVVIDSAPAGTDPWLGSGCTE